MVVALLLLLSRFVRLPAFGVEAEDAIPATTAMLLPLNKAVVAAASDKKTLANTFLPDAVQRELTAYDKFFYEKIPLQKDRPFLAAIYPARSIGIDVLFVVPGHRWLHLEEALQSGAGWQVRTSIFRNHEIHTVQAGAETYAFAKYRNLLLWARHPYLVENAISQLKHPASSPCRDSGFRKMSRRTSLKAGHLDVLLNLETFAGQFAPLINPEKLLDLQQLTSLGSWAHLRLPTKVPPGEWQAAFMPAKGNPLLAPNKRGSKQAYKNVFRYLPDNIGIYAWLSVNDFIENKEAGNQRMKAHLNWAGDEYVAALGEPLENNQQERFVLLKTTDTQKAEASLDKLAEQDTQAAYVDFQMFKILRLQGEITREMEDLGLPGQVACVLGGYVLFSNSEAGMERWLTKYIAGQTYSKNVSFLQSIRTLPGEAHGFFYFESGPAWQQLSPLFQDKQLSAFGGNPLRFGHMAATMTHCRDGRIELAVVTPGLSGDSADKPANILWQASLGSPPVIPPVVFKNPRNGEMEVFVQDGRNRLYLISRSGRILWRRHFDERISSDIHQIDLNNNGEGQFVFSTANGIYILDRQGEDMPGFPLRLQVPATNGVTVVDFFQSKDYRFYIACENGNAYGFDEKGSPVEGWRPKPGVGTVRHPLVHFQAQNMDFLMLQDETGRLQVFQKNGDYRFPEIPLAGEYPQPPAYQASHDHYRIVACDAAGRVHVANLQGTGFKLNMDVGKNVDVRFAFADVTGDNRYDYIALSGETLVVYHYEGNQFKKAFGHSYPQPQDELFPVRWKNDRKNLIGTISLEKMQINLLTGNGQPLPQFPLAGTTRFSVTDLLGDGKPVVVTGNGESIIAYSLE